MVPQLLSDPFGKGKKPNKTKYTQLLDTDTSKDFIQTTPSGTGAGITSSSSSSSLFSIEDESGDMGLHGSAYLQQSDTTLTPSQLETLRFVPSLAALMHAHLDTQRVQDSLIEPCEHYSNPIPPVAPLLHAEFLDIVGQVREAIAQGKYFIARSSLLGIYPTRISQGSSGSYFCKNKHGDIVGVFKPKNEEPYGHLNPKWTKWIHKNLFPCCFGRSCLIPNLGYISEAAASFLDRRLQLNVCPRTEIVMLSSPTFYYSQKDRLALKRGEPLPLKVGSFQLFLNGYKDATTFFKQGYDQVASMQAYRKETSSTPLHPFHWTEETRQEFQMGFERLVVLDYLSRNTDRGSDNWMIRYQPDSMADTVPVIMDGMAKSVCSEEEESADFIQFTSGEASRVVSGTTSPFDRQVSAHEMTVQQDITVQAAQAVNIIELPHQESSGTLIASCSDLHLPKQASSDSLIYSYPHVSIQVAAIDNGLAFPYKHPDRWRSYPYGWSFMPIARLAFSVTTRKQVIHLLTSQEWWRDTMAGLEKLFRLDPDFNESMWRKQKAIVRGQGYNLVETLRRSEAGDASTGSPLALLQRPVVAVYDDETEDEYSGHSGNFMARQRRRLQSATQRFETFRKQPCFSWC